MKLLLGLVFFFSSFSFAQGIGYSVDECQSSGTLLQYSPSKPLQETKMAAAWIFGNDGFSRGNKIMAYTRPKITSNRFPLVGTEGELQLKIAINSPTTGLVPGQTYTAEMLLSRWDLAAKKWSSLIAPTTLVHVLAFSTSVDAWNNKAFCAGQMKIKVEGLYGGAERLDFVATVNFITPFFPR